MRGLLARAVVVLLGFAAPVAAQDGVIPPLERLIDIHLEIPLPVFDCTVRAVRTGAASVGQTLDAIARAHGDSWWEIRRGEVGPIIFFYTFDGSGIGASPGKAR